MTRARPASRVVPVLGALSVALPWAAASAAPPASPSLAVLDARARAGDRQAPPAACERAKDAVGDEVEVLFPYAEAGLSEAARGRLDAVAVRWRCEPGLTITITVLTEHHYKDPQLEADLLRRRSSAVTGYLAGRGVRDVRTQPDARQPAVDDRTVRIRGRGRGW